MDPEEDPILRFKIKIDLYLTFLDKREQGIKALVSIREEFPDRYPDSIIKCQIESDYVFLSSFFIFQTIEIRKN